MYQANRYIQLHVHTLEGYGLKNKGHRLEVSIFLLLFCAVVLVYQISWQVTWNIMCCLVWKRTASHTRIMFDGVPVRIKQSIIISVSWSRKISTHMKTFLAFNCVFTTWSILNGCHTWDSDLQKYLPPLWRASLPISTITQRQMT